LIDELNKASRNVNECILSTAGGIDEANKDIFGLTNYTGEK